MTDGVENTLAEAGTTWRDVADMHAYYVHAPDDSVGHQHLSAMVEQFRKRYRVAKSRSEVLLMRSIGGVRHEILVRSQT